VISLTPSFGPLLHFAIPQISPQKATSTSLHSFTSSNVTATLSSLAIHTAHLHSSNHRVAGAPRSAIRRQIHIEKAPRIVPRRCCITRSSPRPAAGKRPSLLNKAWDRSQTSTSFAKRRFRAPVNLPPTFPFSSFRRAQIVWLGVIESVSTIERSVGAFSGSVVEKRTTFPVLGVLLQSW